ncbi:VCBS repeat-containing protein [Lunatimonas salinarum]|uniref:VCBS repeat-containing protein n=1 Tax=Lunatimonas salinarum TaxID=1774590 RepID=UPI001FD7E592|nr:VCBS repeat-containing protein [Lunatimonas salinarum]
MRFLCGYLILAYFLLAGCLEKNTFEKISSAHSGVFFQNTLFESSELNVLTFEYFYNGAGVGAGDLNNDGLDDLVFTSNMGQSRVYLNKGNFQFEDITNQSGINTEGKWANGVSIIDINQDGFQDVYICFAGPYAGDRRANELYINNGDHTFTERALEYGLADTAHSVQAAFFDYDRDGLLDMYLLNNITDETGPNVIRKKRVDGKMVNTDKLYRNNGDNTFTDVSTTAGITIEGYGLGVSIGDFNLDGWPDIYVSNDYLSNDLFYINQQDGTFQNRASDVFGHTSYSAMGNDVGDFDNDGLLDIVTLDMLPPDNFRQKMMFGMTLHERFRSEAVYGYEPQFMRNTLQWNRGISHDGLPRFSDVGQLAGISATDWSWSALWADLDNDGWRDLLITNGYPKDITNRDFVDYKSSVFGAGSGESERARLLFEAIQGLEGAHVANFVFHNQRDLTFQDVSTTWGITEESFSSGAVYTDLNNDGALDLVISNTGSPAHLFKNNSILGSGHNYLTIRLRGPKNNLDGIGTKIWLVSGDQRQVYEHYLSRGYQSSVSGKIHFGLGANTKVDTLLVVWPDQRSQVLTQVNGNCLLEIAYNPKDDSYVAGGASQENILFRAVQDSVLGIDYRHQETYFSDFNIQPLLPHKLSQLGPGIAVADINGDDLDDFFVGGAFKQSGEIYTQLSDGTFRRMVLDSGNAFEEDMGSLFFDADGDGDLDLYVVSGGNEFEAGSRYYQDRLYINQDGDFLLDTSVLPDRPVSGSCVVSADFDRDGDLDLFVGGRLSPQRYPEPGASMILENQNGKFVDVTAQIAPGLTSIGMVTSAIWSDFDRDGWADLIVVGEWMPVTVYKNEGGSLINVTDELGLSRTRGWWNSIVGADLDRDGYVDYVVGNLGLNSRYKTSLEGPLQIHIADVDTNGTKEAIISYKVDGVRYPIHPRDDLFAQIPSLKRRFSSYASYAVTSVEDLFANLDTTKLTTLSVDTFHTGILSNQAGSAFLFRALPNEAQISPVFGSLAEDFNGDGNLDLLLTGNFHGVEVLTGRYDASYGQVLTGDGRGGFKPATSNLFLEGDTKAVHALYHAHSGRYMYLFSNTDGKLAIRADTLPSAPPIRPGADAAYAKLWHADGLVSTREFYGGSGYLGQSSNHVRQSNQVVKMEMFDGFGKLLKTTR